MRKLLLTITLITLCGLFAALRGGSTAHAVQASAETLPAAQAQDSAADTGDGQCDPAAVSEDAASCAAGGWVASSPCCIASGRTLERWTLAGRTKCCGLCFQ
jgi:hypothetical protein